MSDHPHDGSTTDNRWNHVFVALAAAPRRRLLAALTDEPTRTVSLPTAAMAPNSTVAPQTVDLELRHHHLPLLEASEYVDWEPEPLCATRGPRFDEVRAVVDGVAANASAIPKPLSTTDHVFEAEASRGQ
ncbi:hypothetical protein G6M89_13945 [Natronolimnobius sp. AArcel1]|uniref:hypothetical protein n=1 Tax=Natronolimnobius sp. AArcel1 TaxID=1679093 RepID=UPI0013EC611B|nr:hypothetical protein [Natronolimnobius sp. AArcel1]NGM70095.1 hypothetical protein [Natronolimnobius sp. AArcel1]